MEEFTWLCSNAERLLDEEVQSLENNGRLQLEVKKLKQMVKQVGPFDVVIDGLNVGHAGRDGFSLDTVSMRGTLYSDSILQSTECVTAHDVSLL